MSQPQTRSEGEGQGKANSHPLEIAEIADKILGYLDHPRDLESCFDVCRAWRALVPDQNIRIRPTRPPVLIKGDMSDQRIHSAYLASIRKHPSFKATKFCFRNVMLRSPAIRKFLEQHGEEMEELVFWHSADENQSALRVSTKINMPSPLMKQDFEELFRDKVPNLKALIIMAVPPIWGNSADLFQISPTPTASTSATAPPVTPVFVNLALKKIAITTSWNWNLKSIFDPAQPMSSLLVRFFAASPQLEEFELIQGEKNFKTFGLDEANQLAKSTIRALMTTQRLTQVRILKLSCANKDTLDLLAWALVPNQLTTLRIDEITPDDTFFGPSEVLDTWAVQTVLDKQSGSLQRLELPLFGVKLLQLNIPPMPNLVELQLSRNDLNEDEAIFSLPLVRGFGSINYAATFPRLRVLGLKGLLKNYMSNEIFPDPVNQINSSIQVLLEIPLGVDQELMSRIGRLFPNLRKIHTHISFEQEILLVSIWEFCPNITDLFLEFDTDESRGSRENRCLDSIFTGIPNTECRRLRQLWPEDLKRELTRLTTLGVYEGEPSLLDLKQLKRLCIHGPSTTVRGKTEPSHPDFDYRIDQLSNVFGYSTLMASQELVFFQVREALTKMTPDCIHEVCENARLDFVADGSPGFDPKSVRLIKPGLGLERVGRDPPVEWRLKD